jgi:RNA polymerase sigma factor (sigma-70 family)
LTMIASASDLDSIICSCFENPDSVSDLTDFDAAFRPYVMAILNSMYRGDPGLIEDSYQSAFIKFIKIFRAGAKANTNYIRYFIAVAKNCLIDEVRRLRKYVPIDEIFGADLSGLSASTHSDSDTHLMILQGMELLPRRCQYILESYYIAEMPPADLAKSLGIGEGSVYMAVKRCREELAVVLNSPVRN